MTQREAALRTIMERCQDTAQRLGNGHTPAEVCERVEQTVDFPLSYFHGGGCLWIVYYAALGSPYSK
jgi:hypothetical protein